jgi:AcrR family transcriptional regulator
MRSRQTILDAAARLATMEGLNGLSIGRLAEHIGMSKSGLYAHFGSKEELQLATVETAREIFDAVVVAPTVSVADPVERIFALCEHFLGHVQRRVFPGGCFFISAAAEFDTQPGPVKARISEVTDQWQGGFVQLIEAAQASGLIRAGEDAQQLAFEINAYLVMANMAFVLHDQPTVLDRARTALRARLELARVSRSGAL